MPVDLNTRWVYNRTAVHARSVEDAMAKIKHIAMSTQDPDKTAKFYVDVFGMKQVGRIDNPNTSGYYLTDGDLNLAILKFKNDAVAGVERGKDWSGIHHFGFQVDSLEDITERLADAGAPLGDRSEEHTSELQSRYVISYAVFCLK